MSHEDIETRLARLSRATENVEPRSDFDARVMRALDLDGAARGGGWLDEFFIPARRLLPVAVLAAALAVVWAVRSQSAFDDAVANSDDTVELEW